MTGNQIEFFDDIYRKYYKMMYDVALRIVKNPEIAEDVVADTFLVLITKINAVIEHEQPVKWLFRVLKNNALNERRAQCSHSAVPLDEHLAVAAADNLIPFSGYLPNGLSEIEQKILTLRLSEDLEYIEIAKIMNMTENACRMQYSRARRHCAELFERQKNT